MAGNKETRLTSLLEEALDSLSWLDDATLTAEKRLPEADDGREDKAKSEDNDDDYDPSSGDDSDHEWNPKNLNQDAFVQYLNGLYPQIVAKHQPQTIGPIPGLREEVQPYPHQQHAASFCLNALQSKFKGAIIADPPGLGKTLPALMTIAASRRLGDGPCVVVAPVSCCAQWMREITCFFSETDVSAVLLSGEMIPPLQLLRYHIVVTSYSHVQAELTQILKFQKAIQEYPRLPKDRRGRLPERPDLSLLSGIFTEGMVRLGRLLVLDEAHSIKNTGSRTYAAVALLRKLFEACIMLTGTPLDSTWHDALALFNLLAGHRIRTMKHMREAFTDPTDRKTKGRACVPKLHYFTRFVQMMDACTLRRPLETIQLMLTDLTTELVHFELPEEELIASNDEFRKSWNAFLASRGEQGSEQPATTRGGREKKETMKLEKSTVLNALDQEDAGYHAEVDQDAQRLLKQWREHLSQNERWRSARVDVIIDIINRHRDVYPDDVYIVVDESVYFLEIIKIALCHTAEPIPSYIFDIRMDLVERYLVLKDFHAALGPRVLLASPTTLGAGLNLQCANVLIQCAPWSKQSWEEQAVGRIHRPGQTKPVFVYKIQARDCNVEEHKAKRRDQEQRTNTKIVNAITRVDDAQPPKARECF